MTVHYPIVLEMEATGAVSAYVPGLPVYAAADTQAKAERAIRDVLAAYLEAHPGTRIQARVRVARFSDREKIHLVCLAALRGPRQTRPDIPQPLRLARETPLGPRRHDRYGL